jgi:hypothetical protein
MGKLCSKCNKTKHKREEDKDKGITYFKVIRIGEKEFKNKRTGSK